MTIQEVSASSDFTLNATTDTLINAMTLTPGAGDYLAVFTMDFDVATATAKTLEFSIYVGGSIIQHTERRVDIEGSIATVGGKVSVACTAQVTPTGGQAVEARYRVSADSATAKKRTLTLFPNSASNFSQGTSNTDQSIVSATDTLLTGTNITPGAGTYLAVFSGSATNDSVGSTTNRIFYSVYVNAVQVAHSERRLSAEASISALLGAFPGLIACKVTPTAGQVVEVRARRGTENWTVHERTFTLMKVADADIKEASQTADQADVNTTDALLNSMTVTDPGAADWLTIFSTSATNGVGATQTASYSIYNGGVQNAQSERQMTWDGSIDNGDYYGFSHGKITVANGTDDMTVDWRASTADSRTAHQRTLVMVREAVAVAVTAVIGAARIASKYVGPPALRYLFRQPVLQWQSTVVAAYSLVADKGTYTLIGNGVNLLAGRVVPAAKGTFVLTGITAGLQHNDDLVAANGTYVLTGVVVNLLYGRVISSAKGTFILTGNAANLLHNYMLGAVKGTFALTGNAANLFAGRIVGADKGTYVVTGNAASFIRTRNLQAETGVFSLIGNQANLIYSGAVAAVGNFFVGMLANIGRLLNKDD